MMDSSQIPMEEASGDYGDSDGNQGNPTKKRGSLNIGPAERWISVAAGGALVLFALRRRSWPGALLALAGSDLLLRGATGRSMLYRLMGVNTARRATLGLGKAPKGAVKLDKTVPIDRSPEEIYRFWRDFENLPRVMDHLRSVRTIDERRSHWVAKAPAGLNVEWDAEIIEDVENRRISWRSLEDADVDSQGTVTFEPAADGHGTVVRLSLEYQPPGGKAGKVFAKLFGEEPNQQIDEDLRRLKRMLETDEIAIQGQMAGT